MFIKSINSELIKRWRMWRFGLILKKNASQIMIPICIMWGRKRKNPHPPHRIVLTHYRKHLNNLETNSDVHWRPKIREIVLVLKMRTQPALTAGSWTFRYSIPLVDCSTDQGLTEAIIQYFANRTLCLCYFSSIWKCMTYHILYFHYTFSS